MKMQLWIFVLLFSGACRQAPKEVEMPQKIQGDSPQLNGAPASFEKEAELPLPPLYPQEVMPEFRGDLNAYLLENIDFSKLSPDIVGRVVVKFTVDTGGHVKNAAILEGLDAVLDAQVLHNVQHMPRWKPVKVTNGRTEWDFRVPIRFCGSF